jgi:RimJ/RimL family protein N-acetyltransferase
MLNENIEIATEIHFEGIRQLIEAHYLDHTKYFNPICPSNSPEICERENNIYFVFINENKIISYISLHSDKSFKDNDCSAEFEIIVHPDYRNKDVGKKFLREIILYIKQDTNIKELKAKIKNDNEQSKSLCQKLGFKIISSDKAGCLWHLVFFRT